MSTHGFAVVGGAVGLLWGVFSDVVARRLGAEKAGLPARYRSGPADYGRRGAALYPGCRFAGLRAVSAGAERTGRGHYAAASGGQPLREHSGAGAGRGGAGKRGGRGQQFRRSALAAGGRTGAVRRLGGAEGALGRAAPGRTPGRRIAAGEGPLRGLSGVSNAAGGDVFLPGKAARHRRHCRRSRRGGPAHGGGAHVGAGVSASGAGHWGHLRVCGRGSRARLVPHSLRRVARDSAAFGLHPKPGAGAERGHQLRPGAVRQGAIGH